jgi:hypothetical protein
MAIPNDLKVHTKETVKLSKHKDVEIEGNRTYKNRQE